MNATLTDAVGQVAATLLMVPLLVLPGFAIGAAGDLLGFRRASSGRQWLRAVLIGLALLPYLDSTLARLTNVPTAVGVNVVLALAGAAFAWSRVRGWRLHAPLVAAGLGWSALVLYSWADLESGGMLRHSLVVFDLVKHAATTGAIADTGAPPADMFFGRDTRAGYYYFFYTLPALAVWLGGALIDARAAYSGAEVWAGIGLVALVDILLDRSGLVRGESVRRTHGLLALVLLVAGVDIVPTLFNGLMTGTFSPIPEWWNEQVTWWVPSLLWVPHHVTAVLAAWVGFIVLADTFAPENDTAPAQVPIAIVGAGMALAACAGLSIWVAMGAAVTAAFWFALLLVERRWRAAALLAAAGIVALAFAAPHLHDVIAGRSDAGTAIEVTIRRFAPVESWTDDPALLALLRLLMLPLNYALGFGLFAVGSILFWRLFSPGEMGRTEVGRLLGVSGFVALALGAFFRSVIINNDLGWRIVLFAQLTATVWTIAALVRLRSGRDFAAARQGSTLTRPAIILAVGLLGFATTLYGLVWQRAYTFVDHPKQAYFNTRPDVDLALRRAYTWANATRPPADVLQGNPGAFRVVDFGLYGRNRTGVADGQAALYGASAAAVTKRLDAVLPIFTTSLSAEDVRRRAAGAGIDALVLSALDPVWADGSSWLWAARPVYADALVRIIDVHGL